MKKREVEQIVIERILPQPLSQEYLDALAQDGLLGRSGSFRYRQMTRDEFQQTYGKEAPK